MPFTQTEDNKWGTRVSFTNMRGKQFDRVKVVSMIAFDLSDSSNAYWKCACTCGRDFTAETKQFVNNQITGCEDCMLNDEFEPEAVLMVIADNDSIPLGEEVIYRGNDENPSLIRVEFCGKVLAVSREAVRSTDQNF